jgi:hypothetical protein
MRSRVVYIIGMGQEEHTNTSKGAEMTDTTICAACAASDQMTPATTVRMIEAGSMCYQLGADDTEAHLCDECATVHDEHQASK